MNSFYGGLRGQSFNLVKAYNSKSEMISDFGTASCEVEYGEYVIINSSDSENGNVYRRTNNISENNGAKYICNFSGVAGESASISFSSDYNNINGLTNILTSEKGSFIPGYEIKDGQSVYHDNISFKSQKVKTYNNVNTTVAFQFPYPVIEFNSIINEDITSPRLLRTDDQTHPYYYSYVLEFPENIKQQIIKEIKIITVTNDTIDIYDNPTNKNIINDIYLGKTIVIYTIEETENLQTIESTYFLGEYNLIDSIYYNSTTDKIIFNYNNVTQEVPLKQISNITLSAAGLLNVEYNNSTETQTINSTTPIKWINTVDYNSTNETINFYYNTNEIVSIPFSLTSIIKDYVSNIEISGDGEYILIYKNNLDTPERISLHPLRQISNIVVDDSGLIHYAYTDGTSQTSFDDEVILKWIKNITFNEEESKMIITYNTKQLDNDDLNEKDEFLLPLKSITTARKEDTDLVIVYNTGETTRIEKAFSETINNFNLNETTGVLSVNIGEETQNLGTISYVNNISYDDETAYLQYTYQNELTPHNITQLKMVNKIEITDSNQLAIYYNTEADAEIVGSVSANNILDIDLNITAPLNFDYYAYLERFFPNGYKDNPSYCVAIGPPGQKYLFTYGHHVTVSNSTTDPTENISNDREWYCIGTLNKTLQVAVSDSKEETSIKNLPTGGIWFKLGRPEDEG